MYFYTEHSFATYSCLFLIRVTQDRKPGNMSGRPIARSKTADLLDETLGIIQKAALMAASPCVVGITSPGVPAEVIKGRGKRTYEELVFNGSGTIIESESSGDGKFLSTILTVCTFFIRTNGVQPTDIEVEVYVAGGKLYKCEVIACDFHYNLAIIRIQSRTRLQAAKLRGLDDILSIDPSEKEAHHDSSLFKILPYPYDKVFCIGRLTSDLQCIVGCFSMDYPNLDCKELYSLGVTDPKSQCCWGGPAINCLGEVIGIMVHNQYYLPSNIVLRWWKQYKESRTFCRPSFGAKVVNLPITSLKFLESFVQTFPNISAGVVVTEVAEDSLAYSSGLRKYDVILRCDGRAVRSVLEFVDTIRDKVGGSAEFNIARLSTGESLNLIITINEIISKENFYQWPSPRYYSRERRTKARLIY